MKSVWQRFLIVLAGPMANFLLAILIFVAFLAIGGAPETPNLVESVTKQSAAAQAGIRPGDRIVEIAGRSTDKFEDIAQIVALRAAVIERRDAADRYRVASSTMSADLERIAQVSYDAGERGILELLDAYRGGAAARVRQAELDAAARQAEIELEFVSGWEIR